MNDLRARVLALAVSRDWCWDRFAELDGDPQWGWALDTLAAYVQPEDGAPAIVRERRHRGQPLLFGGADER